MMCVFLVWKVLFQTDASKLFREVGFRAMTEKTELLFQVGRAARVEIIFARGIFLYHQQREIVDDEFLCTPAMWVGGNEGC